MGHLAKVHRDKSSISNDTRGNTPRRQSQSNATQQGHKTHLIKRADQVPAIDEQLQILATHVIPHQ